MTAAIIMAGGRSSRMRATGGPIHKALVPVLGVPMLERNICALFGRGFDDVTVAYAADELAIEDFVAGRGAALADLCGARLEPFCERHPLGTIGAARHLAGRADDVLVVNVDNLTSMDLRALVAAHLESKAAMTVASHVEPFAIPFGALTLDAGRVVEYREKPVQPVRVSSGTYVLGRRALDAITPDRETSIPELVTMLLGSGETIHAYVHDAAWIDVNDAAGVVRAEELLRNHAADFRECMPARIQGSR
jgi:NDP-mannose synthase